VVDQIPPPHHSALPLNCPDLRNERASFLADGKSSVEFRQTDLTHAAPKDGVSNRSWFYDKMRGDIEYRVVNTGGYFPGTVPSPRLRDLRWFLFEERLPG
jgi:hypothetical protein